MTNIGVKTISRAVMLKRMYASDPKADDEFITGVLTTGIYCLPSCSARKPKAENVVFFLKEQEALNAGLRACKRCRPDDYFSGCERDRDRLFEILALIEQDPFVVVDVAGFAQRLGIGLSKLHYVARRYANSTPAGLIHASRIAAAKRFLESGNYGATETAYAVGYRSVSAFYGNFKRRTGLAPGEYARSKRAELKSG